MGEATTPSLHITFRLLNHKMSVNSFIFTPFKTLHRQSHHVTCFDSKVTCKTQQSSINLSRSCLNNKNIYIGIKVSMKCREGSEEANTIAINISTTGDGEKTVCLIVFMTF